MPDLVLDTHACVYALVAPARLGKAARDPFDRLIASACRAVDGRLVTKDDSLRRSGLIRTVWN